jgi:hypothetical protein
MMTPANGFILGSLCSELGVSTVQPQPNAWKPSSNGIPTQLKRSKAGFSMIIEMEIWEDTFRSASKNIRKRLSNLINGGM